MKHKLINTREKVKQPKRNAMHNSIWTNLSFPYQMYLLLRLVLSISPNTVMYGNKLIITGKKTDKQNQKLAKIHITRFGNTRMSISQFQDDLPRIRANFHYLTGRTPSDKAIDYLKVLAKKTGTQIEITPCRPPLKEKIEYKSMEILEGYPHAGEWREITIFLN